MHVSSTDTVESVKEKVAASQLIAFPEHKLMFKGEKMEEGKTMSEYGIQESTGFFVKCGSCGVCEELLGSDDAFVCDDEFGVCVGCVAGAGGVVW